MSYEEKLEASQNEIMYGNILIKGTNQEEIGLLDVHLKTPYEIDKELNKI
jgi:hypothetical protein